MMWYLQWCHNWFLWIQVVILACVAATSAAGFNANPYNPFNTNQFKYKPTPAPYRPVTYAPVFAPTTPAPARYAPVPVARVSADARNANIVKYGNEINPDGSYSYLWVQSLTTELKYSTKVFRGKIMNLLLFQLRNRQRYRGSGTGHPPRLQRKPPCRPWRRPG